MQSILATIRGTYRDQFKCIYLWNQTFFLDILLYFENLYKMLKIKKKFLSLIA